MKTIMKSLCIAVTAIMMVSTCYAEVQIWDEQSTVEKRAVSGGAMAMNQTLDNAAAVNAGSGIVTIPVTGHGYVADSQIYLSGSVNYDGFYTILAVAANTFNIRATYVAETFAGTEIVQPAIGSDGRAYQLLAVRVKLDAASATAENFTITLDSADGAAWDLQVLAKDMNTVQYYEYNFDPARSFRKTDKLLFGWANTNTKTWGLEVIYRLGSQ